MQLKHSLVHGVLVWPALVLSRRFQGRDSCEAGVVHIDNEQFTIQCGVDRAGDNENAGIQTTFDGCSQACAVDPACVTSQYVDGFCYKKTCQNQLSLVSGVITFDKGDGCTADLQVEGCNVQCNTDSPGLNGPGQYVGSYAACAALCASNSKCATASYKTTNGFCYVKSGVNGNGFSYAENVVALVCPNNGYGKPSSSSSSTVKTAPTTSRTTTKTTTHTTSMMTTMKSTTATTATSSTTTTTSSSTTTTTASTNTCKLPSVTTGTGPAPTCANSGEPCSPHVVMGIQASLTSCPQQCSGASNFGQGCICATENSSGYCELYYVCCDSEGN